MKTLKNPFLTDINTRRNDDNVRKKCSIEEFAIFFFNLVRNQTDDFQRGNIASQCNTPGKIQSDNVTDNDVNTKQLIQVDNVILQQQSNQICSSPVTQFVKNTNTSIPQQQQQQLTPSSSSLSKTDLKNPIKSTLNIKNVSSLTENPIVCKENLTKNKLSKSLSNTALITEQAITSSPTIINQKKEYNLSLTSELFSPINKSLDNPWQNQKKIFNNSLTNNSFEQNSFNDSLQLKTSSPINQQQQQQQHQQQHRKNLRKSIQNQNDYYDNSTVNIPVPIFGPQQQQQNHNDDNILLSGRYSTQNRSFENHFKSNTSTPNRKYNRSNDNNISTISNSFASGGGSSLGGNNNKNRNTSFCLGDFILSSPSTNQTKQKNRNNKNFKDTIQSTSSMTVLSTPQTIITDNQNRNNINNTNNIVGLSNELTIGKISSTNNNKPKKRVQPTPVIQTNDGLSTSSIFTRPAFRIENNILNISKEEILDKSNCQILKERVKLKTEKIAIVKEFETLSMTGKQNYLQLKYIQDNLITNPILHTNKLISNNSNNKCQSVNDKTISIQSENVKKIIDFTKITNRHVLNRFIEIHSALIELNLTTNILNEMSYLLNFLNYTDFDEFITISNIATDVILPIELKMKNNEKEFNNNGNSGGNITMTTSTVHNTNIQNSNIKEKQVLSSLSSSTIKKKEAEEDDEEENVTKVDVNFEDDTQIDPKLINHIDDSICNITDCDKFYTILKNFLNCLYYAYGLLDKQKHLLALLDVTTLRVVLDNEHLEIFNKDLKEYLNSIYQHKLKLDNMKSNHETSFKICSSIQTVFYQQENDTKNNFPSEREFLAFKKQRDMFYIILKIWETKHLNHTWNFHVELGSKIHSLLNVMENPINMAHLAKLFTSQLIISSNFSESPSDLEINLPNIDLSKLSKLRQRLVAPSHFSVDYQFPGNQVFFKEFLLTANSVVFAEQLKIVLIAELIEMNNSSYEVINLSNDNMEVDKISNDDDDDDENQRYNEYVVRPEIISTMRVLSKFLGLLMCRPFNYQGNRNSVVDNRQIELRDMLQPEFDLIKILDKSIIEHKLIVTIPWLVQYLSMLDHVTLKLSYYRQLINKLYELYMNIKFYNNYENSLIITTLKYNINIQMRPTSIFILCTCLGWLFENLNICDGYYQYRQQIYQNIDNKIKMNITSNNKNIDNNKNLLKNPLITTQIKDNENMHKILIYIPSNLYNEFNELNKNNEKIIMTNLKKLNNNIEYNCKLIKYPKNNDNIKDNSKIITTNPSSLILPLKNIDNSIIDTDKIVNINQKQQNNNIISINKSFNPLLEGILNVSCPFLADFRVAIMPIKSSKCVSRTGRYRHITTKISFDTSGQTTSNKFNIDNNDDNYDNKNIVKYNIQNSDTQTKLIEAFLHSQSLSVRRIVEFLIERTTSAVIKDYQMEILLPSKTNAMDKINEINSIELKIIINEMYKIFSDIYNETMLKWDKEIPKMIEDRVKKSLDALLPNETLDAVKKTCLEIIIKKCQVKANDWRLTNLNGIEFYSKDIPSDAEKLLKNNSIKKTEQLLPATILEIDMSKPKMSIVFSKLQFALHFTNQRPNLVNEFDLLTLCDELLITLNSHKLPTSFFRVTGVMTVCLVQNLILRHNNILTNNLIEKLINIWLCDGLKTFIQLPNLENVENIKTKPEENVSSEDINVDSANIFNGILSESYLQLILQKSELHEKYSEILVILLNNNLLNINYLNKKFMDIFKHDWSQDEYNKLKLILETITRKTQQIPSNENDAKSILFMEMLKDFISDIDDFDIN